MSKDPNYRSGFKPGNQFWKLRTTVDAGRIMKNAEDLQNACFEYFKACEDNPLESEKVGFSKGKVCRSVITHARAMTMAGLATYIGVTQQTLIEWEKNREDLKPVLQWVKQVMFEQKLSGAAAGIFNQSIIARELGLADKQVHEVATPQMIINPPQGDAPEEPAIFEGDD